MPTRDEDWYRLIEGLPPDPTDKLADGWLDFGAFVAMDSASELQRAIDQADTRTVRRALMAGAISRRLTPATEEQRKEWFRRDATIKDMLSWGEFEG
jgi:hypothetical protein